MTATPARSDAVRWVRLRLRGFGRHRDLGVELPPGLATWVAPNEAGKSTAVLGLVATVWGLPHLQDPNAFGWARYRGVDGAPHRGEVTLERAGTLWTVRRDFDTHRVRVVRHGDGGDEVLIDADHNPNARREGSPYLPWLGETLGLTEAGLVLATFVVAQGAAPDAGAPPSGARTSDDDHRVGAEVQRLVAGSGGGTWDGAQARLEAELRGLTRRVRGLAPGLTRDGRQDQALERVEARLLELSAAIEAGREAAGSFVLAQRSVAAAEARARSARDDAATRRAAARAQGSWIERREATRRAVGRAADLERARSRAAELAGAAAVAAEAGRLLHPGLAGIDPAGFEDRLDAWRAADASARAQGDRLAATRLARDAALRAAQGAVAAALRAERSLGDAPPTPPGGAGSHAAAVAAAELAARRWRDGVAAVRWAGARQAEAEAELLAWAPLADLPEADRRDLRNHGARLAAWAAHLAEAEAAWRAWRERLDDAEARFGDVAGLGDEDVAALSAFARAVTGPEPLAPWRWWGAALVGVALGLVAWLAGGPWWPAALAAVAWSVAWPRRPTLRRARAALAARVAAGASTLVGDDDRLVELARRRDAFDARPPDLEHLVAGEREAADRRARTMAGAGAFRSRWGPLRDALIAAGHGEDVDLGAAERRFERATVAREAARASAAAACRALGAAGPAALGAEAPASASGPEGALLVGWAARQGGVASDAAVEQLEAWLGRLGPATWDAWRAAARRADERAASWAVAFEARAAAEAEAGRVAADHERAVVRAEHDLAAAASACQRARAAALAGADAGVVAGDDRGPEALGAAWRARVAASVRADRAATELATHLRAVGAADLPALELDVEAARAVASAAWSGWRDLVAAHPSLPSAGADAATDGVVDDAFAASRAASAEAAVEAEAAEAALRVAHEALARAQGSDPIDVAAAEIEAEEVRAEQVRLRFERDALSLAATELAAAAAAYRATHLQRLERAAGAYLAAFSATPGRRVRLDAALRASVVEADGRAWVPAQLSQGARDQLALALRWAVADLLAGDVRLPLVFDDPFLHWDDARAQRLGEALRAAGDERQVWLLSHRPAWGAWGTPVVVVEG